MLTEQDVMERLRAAVTAAGSQKAYAEQIRVSQTYLSDVLAGKRSPGQLILDALGLEALLVYRKRHDRPE